MDLEPAIHLRLRAGPLRPGEAAGAGGRRRAQGEAAPRGGGAGGVHGRPTGGHAAVRSECGARGRSSSVTGKYGGRRTG